MSLPSRTAAFLIALLMAPLAAMATGETGGLEEPLPASAESANAEPAQTEAPEAPGPAAEPIPAPDPVIPAGAPEPMAPSGQVSRATFTSAVIEREPIDSIDQLSTVTSRVYFFTELVGFEGSTVTHRWEHGGETLAEVPFHVSGPRWRVYSKKSLLPGWVGSWTVVVLDETGNELTRKTLEYMAAPEPLGTPEDTVPSAMPAPIDAAPELAPAMPPEVEPELTPRPSTPAPAEAPETAPH